MNAVDAFADAWLLAQAVALVLLTTAILLQRFIRQPLERVRLAQIFLAALLLTLFLIFLPQTPRWAVFHVEATPSLSPTDAPGRMETLPSSAISPNNSAAETLPATARENPLSATASAKFTQHAATSTTAENRPAQSAPRNSAKNRSLWNILRHDGRFYLDRSIATLFAAGVFFFGVQWLVGGRKLRKILHEATLVKNSSRENDAFALPTNVRLLVSSAVDAPLVCGVWRPMIVLPHDMSQESRRLAVAHEVAHIARRDLLTWRLLGLFAPLIWIQPLYWLLCRRLRVDQDYLADHSAAAGAPMVEDYATVLLSLAARRQRNFLSSPAILSMSDRPTLLRRRIEMLLSSPPPALRSRRLLLFGAATLLSVLTLALGTVRLVAQTETEKTPAPKIAARQADKPAATGTAKTDAAPAEAKLESTPLEATNADEEVELRLLVIDENKKPVPGAKVELRYSDWDHAIEKYWETDADGRLHVKIPRLIIDTRCGNLNIYHRKLGLWGRQEITCNKPSIPKSLDITCKVQKARRITGQVVDSAGNPVEGAGVNGTWGYSLYCARTDAQGRFELDVTPLQPLQSVFAFKPGVGYDSLSPDCKPRDYWRINRDQKKWQKEGNHNNGPLTLKLEKGEPVAAKVVNAEGKPLEGILVSPEGNEPADRVFETNCFESLLGQKTDANGIVVFDWLPPWLEGIVFWASGTNPRFDKTGNARLYGRIRNWEEPCLVRDKNKPFIFTLPHRVEIQGSVRMADGTPVRWQQLKIEGKGFGTVGVFTNHAGDFSYDVNAGDPITVLPCTGYADDHPLVAPAIKLKTVGDGSQPPPRFDFVLRKGTKLFGQVVSKRNQKPIADAYIQGYEMAGKDEPLSNNQQDERWANANKNGEYAVYLPPGWYRFKIKNYEVPEVVEIKDETEKRLDIQLPDDKKNDGDNKAEQAK